MGEFQIIVDKEVQNDPLSADRLRLLLDIGPKTDIERIAETVRVAIGDGQLLSVQNEQLFLTQINL